MCTHGEGVTPTHPSRHDCSGQVTPEILRRFLELEANFLAKLVWGIQGVLGVLGVTPLFCLLWPSGVREGGGGGGLQDVPCPPPPSPQASGSG